MKRIFQLLALFSILIFSQCESESTSSVDTIIDDVGGNEDSDSEADDNSDGDSNENTEGDGSNDDSSDDEGDNNEDSSDAGETCDNEEAVFDEDDSDSESTSECAQLLNEGTVSCIANEIPFVSTGILSAGGYEEVEGAFVFGVLAGDGIDENVDITATDQRGIAILLSSIDMGLDDVEENVEYRGTNGENLFSGGFEVLASYVKVEDCETTEIGLDISPTAVIEFSEIDRENQLITGTFSFIAFDEDSGITYPVLEGTFENLWYCDQSTIEGKFRIFDDKLKQLLDR